MKKIKSCEVIIEGGTSKLGNKFSFLWFFYVWVCLFVVLILLLFYYSNDKQCWSDWCTIIE